MSRLTRPRARSSHSIMRAGLTAAALIFSMSVHAQFVFNDISPDQSSLDPSDPDGASGGRVNGLAVVAGDNSVYYAASEWGGLYKSTDGGLTWSRLNSHEPPVTWDVEVDPSDDSKVYATSFYDGRTSSLSGINVSSNAGATWTRPTSVVPPAGFCNPVRRTELSGFGISVDPDSTNDVYVGTTCGLAVSNDAGASWTYIDPTPGSLATTVWDVVVHDGGIIDVCGNDGHQRSTDGGGIWTTPGNGLPTGRCSIAVSPDEQDVLFAAVGADIYESDDGGANWTQLGTPDSRRQGRVPFVATNQRSDSGDDDVFDLWYGDVRLFRASCTSDPDGGGLRCPMAYVNIPNPYSVPSGWSGPFTRTVGGHDDVGDIVFDSAVSVDSCPTVFSSDGGVYYNTSGSSPGCHTPAWEQPLITPHGLWPWTMTGDGSDDLYFGNQDNGMFGTIDGGSLSPTWTNEACCDVFDTAADATQVMWTFCCGSPRSTTLRIGPPGAAGSSQVNTYPADGLLRGFRFPDTVANFGTDNFAVITRDCAFADGIDNDGDGLIDEPDEVEGGCTGANNGDGGIYITQNASSNPITWTELGNATEPWTGGGGACAVETSVDGGSPVLYVQVGNCNGNSSDQLWRFVGTDPAGTWQSLSSPTGGVANFAVDPNDANRLLVSTNAFTPRVLMATDAMDDSSPTYEPLDDLNDLMDGAAGEFNLRTNLGPTAFTGFNGYAQPSLLAFDPESANIMVAGGEDSGVFLSTNAGEHWTLITSPIDPVGSGAPHLPRPRFAHFDHDNVAGEVNMYLGSQGRGVWRVKFPLPPIADANGPYSTIEGTDVALDGTGSLDPNGSALTYEWDFDDDGDFDDATGPTPDFDLVGQDGEYPVNLRVTNSDGLFDTDDSVVIVDNVAPSVSFNSDAPKDENSVLTISGVVSDPGWLEALTATVDWGDGAGPQALTGVLENDRPDATLTFEETHTYGDNGTYTITVCGFDDDTSTCEQITAQVDNVDPTAEINTSSAVTLPNGDEVIFGGVGEDVEFSGRSTDPGSDDLVLSWDWDDGPPSPDVSTTYLVNPPTPDPPMSPSIQPRDVIDTKLHAFDLACTYEVGFFATDDDGGASPTALVSVVILGAGDAERSAGYWRHQVRQKGRVDFSEEELLCYLDITGLLSLVFDEDVDVSTLQLAEDVLFVGGTSDMADLLDRQLLAVWLNFANGVWGFETWDTDGDTVLDAFGPELDSDGDGVADTYLSQVIYEAESVRLDPTSTLEELEERKNILEALNLTGAL